MLKIKDNVDLKELEKYEFVYDKNFSQYMRGYYDIPDIVTIVNVETRKIITFCDAFTYDRDIHQEEYIKDLIKNNIIEKVDEQ